MYLCCAYFCKTNFRPSEMCIRRSYILPPSVTLGLFRVSPSYNRIDSYLHRYCFVDIFRSTYQMIRLQNPTSESLVLTPHCSNPANFSLELDNSQHVLLSAGSQVELPLKFTPSAIGSLHTAEISLQCPQVNLKLWFDIYARV